MPTHVDASLATLEMIQDYQKKGVKEASSLRLACAKGEFRKFPAYTDALEEQRANKNKDKAEKLALDRANKAPEGDWVKVLKKKPVKKYSKPAALVQVPPNEGAPGALRVVKKVTTYYKDEKPKA